MRNAPQDGAIGTADQSVAQDFVQLPKRQIVLTMIGVLLAMFLASLDQTVVATAMPRIIADLGGFDRFTWVTTAYLVASTTAVPIVGRLTDIHGRKIFYVAGIIVFLIGSVLAGLSQTMNQLIVFRAIQGLGGGVIMVNSFTAIADLFPPETRGKYQGFIGVTCSDVVGHRADAWRLHHGQHLVELDILHKRADRRPGAAADRVPVSGDQAGGGEPQARLPGHGHAGACRGAGPAGAVVGRGAVRVGFAQVIGLLVFGVIMIAAFVTIEYRSDSPIMPLEIYRNRMVSVSLVVTFLTGFGMFGGIIFIPLFFQGVLGASATSSGSFLTPMMLGIVVGATLSGQLLARTGLRYRPFGLGGIALQ